MAKYYVKCGRLETIVSCKDPAVACMAAIGRAVYDKQWKVIENLDFSPDGNALYFYVDERGHRGPDKTLNYHEETCMKVVDENTARYSVCSHEAKQFLDFLMRDINES